MTKFEEVLTSFWRDAIDDDHVALTDAAIADAEEKLGVRLPAALLRLLRVRNGGHVADRWDAFPVEGSSWSEHYACFDYLEGILDENDSSTILDTPYLVQEWDLPAPVVLLHGDGHWWVALDYRACGPTGEPSVVEIDSDGPGVVFLAPDFDSFVEGLTASEQFLTDDQIAVATADAMDAGVHTGARAPKIQLPDRISLTDRPPG
ncbi:SMI1/KNR4 family protein [Nocardia sp. NPDC051463]|uniref:SMI1/KNR4 family protein n=1 Tax=Nocardia sp. NPDC051463 TaxID=3154845 RepID=UPI00343FB2B1